MSQKIRFFLDEHIDPNIARGLRRYGIDVTTTVDVGLRTQSDELHLAFIREDQRVLEVKRIFMDGLSIFAPFDLGDRLI